MRLPPTLALCMIVKNEEAVLDQCLESVSALIDDIILVDTGSTDNTKEVGRRFGARIVSAPWKNNFSWARNVSLEYAKSDWILVLDADETICPKDHARIRDCFTDAHRFGFALEQRTYGNNPNFKNWIQSLGEYGEETGYAGYVRSPLVRLFRNDDRIRFEGAVHELVEPALTRHGLPYGRTSIPIHHYGKVREPSRMEEKARLYLAIGKQKVASHPDNPKALSELGAQHLELKSYPEAVSLFQRVAALKPGDPDVQADLGATLLRQGEFKKAEAALQTALSFSPDHIDALFNLGAIFLKKGRYDEAEPVFSRILKIHPAHGNAYAALGSVYLCRKRTEEAVPYLLKAARMNPGDADVYSNLAWAFVRLGWPEQALACGRKAMALNPDHRNANRAIREAEMVNPDPHDSDTGEQLNRKGEDLYAQHRLVEAEDCFRVAIKNDPLHGQAWNNLGVVCWHAGNKESALNCFLRASLLLPHDSYVSKNLTDACENLEKTMLRHLMKEFKESDAAISTTPETLHGYEC